MSPYNIRNRRIRASETQTAAEPAAVNDVPHQPCRTLGSQSDRGLPVARPADSSPSGPGMVSGGLEAPVDPSGSEPAREKDTSPESPVVQQGTTNTGGESSPFLSPPAVFPPGFPHQPESPARQESQEKSSKSIARRFNLLSSTVRTLWLP